MESSQGVAPEGFKTAARVDPKPSEDGIIHAESPVSVEFDLCGSTVEPGKTAHYLFDWTYDHVVDVEGTGETCLQKHTFRTPADATGPVVIETNVCVTNGDPSVHDGSTYFSCRTYRVGLPAPGAKGSCVSGRPAGCQPLSGGGVIGWDGGTGPHENVPLFAGDVCEGTSDPSPFPVVIACTLDEAQALCELSEPPIVSFSTPDGQLVVLCEAQPTLKAGAATRSNGWTRGR